MHAPIDPSDPEQVNVRLLEYIRNYVASRDIDYAEAPQLLADGTDTFVYGFHLRPTSVEGLWAGPLVIRIFRRPEEASRAERETAIQQFARNQGYRTPAPVAVDPGDAHLGLPFVVMERAAGVNLLTRFTSNPLSMFRLVRTMAQAQAELHRIPVDQCPIIVNEPLVERRLAALSAWMGRCETAGTAKAYAWLAKHSAVVSREERSLCHNDFHPLNIIIDGAGGWSVIDWSRADIGDRLHDVARTHVIMTLAQGGGRNLTERLLLNVSRFVASRYLKSYAQFLPFDRRRLLYWRALLTFQSWVETAPMMAEGAEAVGARPGATSGYRQDIVTKIQEEFQRRVEAFEVYARRKPAERA